MAVIPALRSVVSPSRRVALVAGVALLASCGSLRGAPRVALVIGNAAYENVPALKNPVHDADDMCAALLRVGFATMCHTNLRDRDAFDARVREYVDLLGPDTVGVVYYSGHGVQANNANFLIPTRVSVRSATENPLRALYGLDDLFDRLRTKPTHLQLVILDACRTELFPQAAREPGAGVATTAARTALQRSLEATGNASTGLTRIQDAPSSTVVLYATASRGAASDGKGRNGPFTEHVLKHIGTSDLLLDEFIRRVIAGVRSEADQTPFQYGSYSGRFCFAGCRPVPPPFN
jgi:uncharacterized caspase-like protein